MKNSMQIIWKIIFKGYHSELLLAGCRGITWDFDFHICNLWHDFCSYFFYKASHQCVLLNYIFSTLLLHLIALCCTQIWDLILYMSITFVTCKRGTCTFMGLLLVKDRKKGKKGRTKINIYVNKAEIYIHF